MRRQGCESRSCWPWGSAPSASPWQRAPCAPAPTPPPSPHASSPPAPAAAPAACPEAPPPERCVGSRDESTESVKGMDSDNGAVLGTGDVREDGGTRQAMRRSQTSASAVSSSSDGSLRQHSSRVHLAAAHTALLPLNSTSVDPLALACARHVASSFREFGAPHRASLTQQRSLSA